MALKDLYFEESDEGGWIKAASREMSAWLVENFPKLSIYWGYRLLANPHSRRDVSFSGIVPTEEFSVESKLGKVKVYHFAGTGPAVLLCHGWGDTSQRFDQLIHTLSDLNYSIYCFDHIGHGKSQGRVSHVFGFINGLEKVVEEISKRGEDLDSIIAHSMGCVAALNLDDVLFSSVRVVLVSLPADFFKIIFDGVSKAGVSKRMLKLLIEDASRIFEIPWESIPLKEHQHKLRRHVMLIHDTKDRFTPFEPAHAYAAPTSAQFMKTKGLGHHRILRDPVVLKSIVEFIKF